MTTTNSLEKVLLWFQKAVPKPVNSNFVVQLGCHFEEVAEMLETLKAEDRLTQAMLTQALVVNHALALHLKNEPAMVKTTSTVLLFDALCDQIVTAVGIGHMAGLPMVEGLEEVNASNWSKFVDGEPVFNEKGKIMKGPGYQKPDLMCVWLESVQK